jgi:hypothetical protein
MGVVVMFLNRMFKDVLETGFKGIGTDAMVGAVVVVEVGCAGNMTTPDDDVGATVDDITGVSGITTAPGVGNTLTDVKGDDDGKIELKF